MNIKNGEIWYSASEYDALQSQRDELLEALKRSLSQHKGCDCGVCDQMEAAIRLVEEGR